jgi:fluoride exporter
MPRAIIAISVGASLGALLRWWLASQLNTYFPTIPLGTLAANLIGGYIIGLAGAFFTALAAMAPEWRLLVMTGFCGGLTTFSTFSAEVVFLLQHGQGFWAFCEIAVHVLGSLFMTGLGIGTVEWLRLGGS